MTGPRQTEARAIEILSCGNIRDVFQIEGPTEKDESQNYTLVRLTAVPRHTASMF